MHWRSFILGAKLAIIGRALVPRLLRIKFSRDVARLNGGDHSSLLTAYADDAVLRFNDGDHRWAGRWEGRSNIDRFLQNYTAARVQGTIREIAVSGAPWALRMWVRFDDHADAPDGTRLYENRTVLVLRTRWGKIVDQEDFYVDTEKLAALDGKLDELGVERVPRTAAST
jgi:ketosteroid isomerase-like protein